MFAGGTAAERPAPATIDELERDLGVRALTFVAQPRLTEFAGSWTGSTSMRDAVAPVRESASLTVTYTLLRDPEHPDDPGNLRPPSELAALDVEPVAPLPSWMLEHLAAARFPWLWDSVRTTVHAEPGTRRLADELVQHAEYILMNSFRDERAGGAVHGHVEIDGAPTSDHLRPTNVEVDGVAIPGLVLDTDPHVFGLAADVGPWAGGGPRAIGLRSGGVRWLTVVVPRGDLDLLDLRFVSRGEPGS